MEKTLTKIPDGWIEITLGDVLKYEQPYNYTVDSTEYDSKSGIPVLTAGKSFLLGYTNETTNIYTDIPVIIFDDFTTNSKFVDFPFKVKSSAMKFLKPKNGKNQNIYFFFEVIQSLRIRGTFSDHKRRWISEFSKIEINSPLYKEQTRIAQIFLKADRAIEQTEKLIAKYQRIKTGLMQDLLTKGIDEYGNIRSEETHEFKDSLLGRIPKEWNVVNVGFLCSENVVGIVIKPTQYYTESGIPMLRSFNIKEGEIKMNDLVYMSKVDNEKLSKSKLLENDVVSVRTGYPGTSAIITKDIAGSNCIDLVISRVKTDLLNPNFLVIWINSELSKRQILNHKRGIAQQHFNVGQMKELLIFKITLKEQNRILEQSNKLKGFISNLQLSLSKLQSLKAALMQDLLSGKVRVKI